MQVWNVLHAARWKCRTQKIAKNRHLGTIPQLCLAISLQLRNVSTIGKNLLSSNISSTCPHNMVNFGPLAAEIVSLVWGTPANFNGFRILAALLHSQTLWRWTEGATYIRQGGHHVGHWPTFLVTNYNTVIWQCSSMRHISSVRKVRYINIRENIHYRASWDVVKNSLRRGSMLK